MILTGKVIDAAEALRIGLLHSVAEPDELIEECRGLAAQLGEKSPVAMRYALRAIHEGFEADLATGLKLEGLCVAACLSSEDAKEGLAAFVEKRTPEFKGK